MSDEIKRQIDDLKREVKKATDMLYDTKSRFERLEQELKKELKNVGYVLKDIKDKINQINQ